MRKLSPAVRAAADDVGDLEVPHVRKGVVQEWETVTAELRRERLEVETDGMEGSTAGLEPSGGGRGRARPLGAASRPVFTRIGVVLLALVVAAVLIATTVSAAAGAGFLCVAAVAVAAYAAARRRPAGSRVASSSRPH